MPHRADKPPEHALPLQPPLIIADGGLAGLVACWSAHLARTDTNDPGALSVADAGAIWMPNDALPAQARRQRCLAKQAQMSGFNKVHTSHGALTATDQSAPLHDTAMLLSACHLAMTLGLRRIVWPVSFAGLGEPDLAWLADVTDRALLVSQLASIDMPRVLTHDAPQQRASSPARSQGAFGDIRIETPYVDLDDAQLMDLALDMDVPLGAAWWCEQDVPEPARACGFCPSCLRCRAALAEVDPQGLLRGEGLFADQEVGR